MTSPVERIRSYHARQRPADLRFIDDAGTFDCVVVGVDKALAKVLGKRPAEDRPWRVDYSQPMSAYEYYGHEKAGS